MGLDRKAAIAAYKERKVVAGVYRIRCLASGQFWVGQAPNLEKIENRLRFTLQQGTHRHRGLQEAWLRHGADTFVLEPVEQLEEETDPYLRDRSLKDRLTYWAAALGAPRI
ncbi:MAG TPA: GIY-YIG nuclease family protein [Bosea sp. (in: a-proteobacteria)]|uniref:GIY-YIG nuclease family protein n=1 Tax=Bosea sp. (in: a-proteobacteria) TaxID=1871050 RepID=UPI002E12E261|nr:GIY-YIG nuclease family protein [Bosea sp. (in: a-proteobacteria)]